MDAGEAILPACPASRSAHVLEDDEPAGRAQHAVDLGERAGRIVDRAEDERRDHGVEARVRERERLRPAVDELHRNARLGDLRRQPLRHARIGLERYDSFGRGVVAQVRSGAGADLEDLACDLREELVPQRAQLTVLRAPGEEVVEPAVHASGRVDSARLASSSTAPCAASSLPRQIA